MEKVKIGDVALAYENLVTLKTYLLVMRNALLILMMDHNLLPQFLIREASSFLDETLKFQLTSLLRDNHTIYDDGTGLRIHLQLNGILLLSDKIAPPDSDQWDPQS